MPLVMMNNRVGISDTELGIINNEYRKQQKMLPNEAKHFVYTWNTPFTL